MFHYSTKIFPACLMTRLCAVLAFACFLIASPHAIAQRVTSSFNESWLDVIVSIELSSGNGGSQALGTGFIVESPNQNLVLITAKHVLAPLRGQFDNVFYLLNNEAGDTRDVSDRGLRDSGFGDWIYSGKHDLAFRFFAWPPGFEGVFIPGHGILDTDLLQAGAPIFVLGYPLGLRDVAQALPITRTGSVARADEDSIMIDAFVFPGNSGGPVIYSPPIKVTAGISSPYINEEKLVGMVVSFIPYSDKAVSQKTGRARIVFEENTGLANVLPANEIMELLNSDEVRKMDIALREQTLSSLKKEQKAE